MTFWKKIFIAFGILWLAIVYAAYYNGIINGIQRFHPGILDRIRELFS